MIESSVEKFEIGKCPVCGQKHILNINVYRDNLPNDLNKDVRVPIIRNIKIPVICPTEQQRFEMELMIQEDVYSKIVKMTNP